MYCGFPMGVVIESGWMVAGTGNRWSGDDAIGLRLVESLTERKIGPGVETVIWEDADALTLTHELLERNRPTLIVDCAEMGAPPGSWRSFPSEVVALNLRADGVSTHGLGIAEALSLASSLGFDRPAEIFGVQPFDVSPGSDLSPAMQQRFPQLADALFRVVLSLARTAGKAGEAFRPRTSGGSARARENGA